MRPHALLFSLIILSTMTLQLAGCGDAAGTIKEERLMVSGMHCDACAAGIQQSVASIDGVDSCQASYPSEEVLITFHGKRTMQAAIKRIEAMGFTVNRQK